MPVAAMNVLMIVSLLLSALSGAESQQNEVALVEEEVEDIKIEEERVGMMMSDDGTQSYTFRLVDQGVSFDKREVYQGIMLNPIQKDLLCSPSVGDDGQEVKISHFVLPMQLKQEMNFRKFVLHLTEQIAAFRNENPGREKLSLQFKFTDSDLKMLEKFAVGQLSDVEKVEKVLTGSLTKVEAGWEHCLVFRLEHWFEISLDHLYKMAFTVAAGVASIYYLVKLLSRSGVSCNFILKCFIVLMVVFFIVGFSLHIVKHTKERQIEVRQLLRNTQLADKCLPDGSSSSSRETGGFFSSLLARFKSDDGTECAKYLMAREHGDVLVMGDPLACLLDYVTINLLVPVRRISATLHDGFNRLSYFQQMFFFAPIFACAALLLCARRLFTALAQRPLVVEVEERRRRRPAVADVDEEPPPLRRSRRVEEGVRSIEQSRDDEVAEVGGGGDASQPSSSCQQLSSASRAQSSNDGENKKVETSRKAEQRKRSSEIEEDDDDDDSKRSVENLNSSAVSADESER